MTNENIGRDFWDISPLFEKKAPRPKELIECPGCKNKKEIWFKHAYIHKRSSREYRVDILVKCNHCALVFRPECWSPAGTFAYGVHISREEYEKLKEIWGKTILEYKETGHTNLNELVR